MITINNKKECCGCYACYNACPVDCIEMVRDTEGFAYPAVDREKCVDCGKCIAVCPFINVRPSEQAIKVYACQNKDERILRQSSSGGYFSVLAKKVLSHSGAVYGAVYNENFHVIHDKVENLEDLYRLRGSKYVQSNIRHSYREVKSDLDGGKQVLYSGTPCQIAGLKRFLGNTHPQLILVDIVCHGVPSPNIYEEYLAHLKGKYNSGIKRVDFRAKEIAIQALKVDFENAMNYENPSETDIYYRVFLADILLRPSCYACKSNNHRSGSDISLADFWGCSEILGGFNEQKEGTSLVITRTEKGEKLFSDLLTKINYKEATLDQAKRKNPNIENSCLENPRRRAFFKDYASGRYPIDKLLKKYAYRPFHKRAIGKIKREIKKIF